MRARASSSTALESLKLKANTSGHSARLKPKALNELAAHQMPTGHRTHRRAQYHASTKRGHFRDTLCVAVVVLYKALSFMAPPVVFHLQAT